MASSEILELVQFELSNARNMAEHADNGFLLYLIDMAILEVKRKSCSGDADREPSSTYADNIRSIAIAADFEAPATALGCRPEESTARSTNLTIASRRAACLMLTKARIRRCPSSGFDREEGPDRSS